MTSRNTPHGWQTALSWRPPSTKIDGVEFFWPHDWPIHIRIVHLMERELIPSDTIASLLVAFIDEEHENVNSDIADLEQAVENHDGYEDSIKTLERDVECLQRRIDDD